MEGKAVKIIKRNLREQLFRAVYSMMSYSMEHLRDLCRQYKSVYKENLVSNVLLLVIP